MYIHLQAGCHSYFWGKMERSPTVLRTDFKATALSEEKELCLQHFFFPNQVASELLKEPI